MGRARDAVLKSLTCKKCGNVYFANQMLVSHMRREHHVFDLKVLGSVAALLEDAIDNGYEWDEVATSLVNQGATAIEIEDIYDMWKGLRGETK